MKCKFIDQIQCSSESFYAKHIIIVNGNQGSTCNNVIYMYNYVIILILVRAHGPSIFITFFLIFYWK